MLSMSWRRNSDPIRGATVRCWTGDRRGVSHYQLMVARDRNPIVSRLQEIVDVPEHEPWLGVTKTKVTDAGNVGDDRVRAVDGPRCRLESYR